MSNLPRFQELEYTQPSISIQQASERAIRVIKDLLEVAPSALPYIMEPSAILVFANLRTQSPYHILGDEVTGDIKAKLDAVLLKHTISRWEDDTRYDDPKTGIFSLVNSTVFNQIPNHYGFAKSIWKCPVQSPNIAQICEWVLVMERSFAGLMESDSLPREWLRDWWAPHNLRFGMLLGYPGVAISSALWAASRAHLTNSEFDETEVLIAAQGTYFGTQVAFYLHPKAKDDPSVKGITHVWSEVIRIVYDRLPLSELLKNSEFASGYHHLEKRETN